jgi:hypothetical protein
VRERLDEENWRVCISQGHMYERVHRSRLEWIRFQTNQDQSRAFLPLLLVEEQETMRKTSIGKAHGGASA